MTDSHVLWIIAVLVALDLLLAWFERRDRIVGDSLSYGCLRMINFNQRKTIDALNATVPSGHMVLSSIGKRLDAVLGKEDQILMEIDDLKKALADLEAEESSVVAGMTAAANELHILETELAQLANQQTVSPADLANAALRIKAVTSNLGAAVAALAAAAPPAAPAAPISAATEASAASGS